MDLNEQLTESRKSPFVFDSFILKIIAIFTMTLDHMARIIMLNFSPANDSPLFYVCLIMMIVGRIAFILFAFLLVKSMLYTRSQPKYILRLSIMTILIGGVLLVTQYAFEISQLNNIFLTLLLGALIIFLLEHKNAWFKPIAILPALYVFLCNFYRDDLLAMNFPEALIGQYEFYGILIILGIYLGHKLYNVAMNQLDVQIGVPKGTSLAGPRMQSLYNILPVVIIIIINIGAWGITYFTSSDFFIYFYGNISHGNNIQFFSLLALPFMALYNEKVGYNKKWFRYFTYAYYPLHILIGVIIIYVVGLLLF